MLNFGMGTQMLDQQEPNFVYTLGLGYRQKMIGVSGEFEIAQVEGESVINSMRAQARAYISVGDCLDLYPLVGVSRTNSLLENDAQVGVDLGLGIDKNFAGIFALGARYTRTLFNDTLKGAETQDERPQGAHSFIVQMSLFF